MRVSMGGSEASGEQRTIREERGYCAATIKAIEWIIPIVGLSVKLCTRFCLRFGGRFRATDGWSETRAGQACLATSAVPLPRASAIIAAKVSSARSRADASFAARSCHSHCGTRKDMAIIANVWSSIPRPMTGQGP
jgi:hypothetical protein